MTVDPKSLSDDISVSPQISFDDIEGLKAAGFKSVIINRPDGEAPGQPSAADLIATLEENGLNIRNLPLVPGQLTPDLISQSAEAFSKLPKPILAFCASGTRSTILWCCVHAQDMGTDAVLNAAANAGYNLEQIRPLLNQLSNQG